MTEAQKTELRTILSTEPTTITVTDLRRNRRFVRTLVDANERFIVTRRGKKLYDLWPAPLLYKVLGASFTEFAEDRQMIELLSAIVKTAKLT